MLKHALRDMIEYPSIRLLYDGNIINDHPEITKIVRSYVKKLRQKYNAHDKVDQYKTKEEQFCGVPAHRKGRVDVAATSGVGQKCIRGTGDKRKKGEKRTFYTGGWYKAQIVELEKAVLKAKEIPADLKGQLRSIEFEVIFSSGEMMKRFITEVRCKTWAKQIHLKEDNSVRDENAPGTVGREISMFYRIGNEHQVRELCAMLKDKAYTNKRCGTHVHFDMRHVNEKTAMLYGRRLARCIPALKTILPPSRRINTFCATPINNLTGAGDGGHSRYAFVNMEAYKKYQTIEVRAHGGTINANKILSWIKLCEIIMTSRVVISSNEIMTIEDLIATYKFDGEFANYLRKRVGKFNAHGVNPDLEDVEGLEAPMITNPSPEPIIKITGVAPLPEPHNVFPPPIMPQPEPLIAD